MLLCEVCARNAFASVAERCEVPPRSLGLTTFRRELFADALRKKILQTRRSRMQNYVDQCTERIGSLWVSDITESVYHSIHILWFVKDFPRLAHEATLVNMT